MRSTAGSGALRSNDSQGRAGSSRGCAAHPPGSPLPGRFDEPPSPFADPGGHTFGFSRCPPHGQAERVNVGPAEPGDDADAPATKTAAPKEKSADQDEGEHPSYRHTVRVRPRAGDQHGTDGATGR